MALAGPDFVLPVQVDVSGLADVVGMHIAQLAGNTVAAALLVGLVQTVATSLLPFDYVYLMLYAGLAVVLVVRREGLVGANRRTI